jgi:hypothetical protein
MSNYRHAALALHGLPEADRAWVLAQLPHDQRNGVTRYLAELQSLGFTPADSAAVAMQGAAAPPEPEPSRPFLRVRAATPDRMFALLHGEPASLIAQVLAIRDWPWADEFLQRFSPMRRERIKAGIAQTACLPAMRIEFLIDECAKCLPLPQDNSAAAPALTAQAARSVGPNKSSWLLKWWAMPWNR